MQSVASEPNNFLVWPTMKFKRFKTTVENGIVSLGTSSKRSGYIKSMVVLKRSRPTASAIRPRYCVSNVMWSIVLARNISLYVALIAVINCGLILASLHTPIT